MVFRRSRRDPMESGVFPRPSGAYNACTRCGRRPCSVWQGRRAVGKLGRTTVTYRGCVRRTLFVSVAVAGLLLGGGPTGVLLTTGPVAAFLALVWLATSVRLVRPAPACGDWGGGLGEGGAGVREPRRPKPFPPADAIALPPPSPAEN